MKRSKTAGAEHAEHAEHWVTRNDVNIIWVDDLVNICKYLGDYGYVWI